MRERGRGKKREAVSGWSASEHCVEVPSINVCALCVFKYPPFFFSLSGIGNGSALLGGT